MTRITLLALLLAGCAQTAPVAEIEVKPCSALQDLAPQLNREFGMRPVGLGGEGRGDTS